MSPNRMNKYVCPSVFIAGTSLPFILQHCNISTHTHTQLLFIPTHCVIKYKRQDENYFNLIILTKYHPKVTSP